MSAQNVVVLGVSFDTVQENAAFANKFDFPFKLLCDTDREIGVAYQAAADKSAGSAKRVSYLIGEDGKILEAWPKVDPKTHPQEVLDRVKAL